MGAQEQGTKELACRQAPLKGRADFYSIVFEFADWHLKNVREPAARPGQGWSLAPTL